MQRFIYIRGRKEGKNFKLARVRKIHNIHEEWLRIGKCARIVILNGDLSLEDIILEYQKCCYIIWQGGKKVEIILLKY